MEYFQSIAIEMISNLIWVIVVFIVFFFWERRKKKQMDRCLEAYTIFLLKSTSMVRNTIYPYLHLIKLQAAEGDILFTLLGDIQEVISSVLSQTQEALQFTESQKMQEKILKVYHQVILFQSHVSESKIKANIIVGNPTELVEEPHQEKEIETFIKFSRHFHELIRGIYGELSPSLQDEIPQDILEMLEKKSPLQEQFE